MPPFHHSKRTSIISLFPGAPNSAKFKGACRGSAKIRQRGGGVAIIFYFLRVKNITFRVLCEVFKKCLLLRMLRYKKVLFSEFLRKAIEERFTFKNFYSIKIEIFRISMQIKTHILNS